VSPPWVFVESPKSVQAAQQAAAAPTASLEDVVSRAVPGVVSIRAGRARGSGFFVRPATIVTNAHVVEGQTVVQVQVNGIEYSGAVTMVSPGTDLAVVEVSNPDPRQTALRLGTVRDIRVGQEVVAIGSALGVLSNTVTRGIVSAIRRAGPVTLIQTDAAINPGNSGGPLVDLSGRVIGINSRAFLMANTLGFSIPANVVKEVVGAIIDKGRVERSWIGVEVQPLQELEDFFDAHTGGVLVSDIEPDSPAATAGLRAGDLIVRIDGRETSARFYEEIPAFYKRIADIAVGHEVRLDYRRGGAVQSVSLTTQEYGRASGADFEAKEWGFAVRGITKQMTLELRLTDAKGVLVSGVKGGSPAEEAGLAGQDIVRLVDDTEVTSLDDFRRVYADRLEAAKGRVMLKVTRRDTSRYVLLKLSPGQG
jgi:serine protease Do